MNQGKLRLPTQKILRVVQYDRQAQEMDGTEEFWVVDIYSTNISKRCRSFQEALEWVNPPIKDKIMY